MREYRSSGSVEGVMGDHDSYSDLWRRAGYFFAPAFLRLRIGSLLPTCVSE